MRICRVLVVVLLCIAFGSGVFAQSTAAPQAAAQPAPGQPPAQAGASAPPTPTIRVYVTRVVLDVLVTDAKGGVVTGLTRDDFKVTDAGEPQTITNFDT
jgi:hypothetical protein